ncbi:MAG: pyridoxal phosphate enzyme (YggS family) [Cellvibrionaceae bacterium]|jgi:pyridoxal phosphate enzyme (YggS family)
MGIRENSLEIIGKINDAAARAGRDAAGITLVAVTKTHPPEVLAEAWEAGLRHFGENRAQELEEKVPWLTEKFGPDNGITWHYIGHLQTRQSQPIANYGHMFHAADRPKIINRLSNQLAVNGRTLDTLLEVNISGEASKGGFNCSDWENNVDQQKNILSAAKLLAVEESHQTPAGLMTMAPWGADPHIIRAVFERTRNLRNWLSQELEREMPVLSMGMTDDFEIAIEEGATHVRVGRALFGDRH